jgi:hypothetical protein
MLSSYIQCEHPDPVLLPILQAERTLLAALLEKNALIQELIAKQDQEMATATQALAAAGQQQRAAVTAVEQRAAGERLQLTEAAAALQNELEDTQDRLSRVQLLLKDSQAKLASTEAINKALLMHMIDLVQDTAATAASLEAAKVDNVRLLGDKLRLETAVEGLSQELSTATLDQVGGGRVGR